jgi:hypothetical protein
MSIEKEMIDRSSLNHTVNAKTRKTKGKKGVRTSRVLDRRTVVPRYLLEGG